MREPNARMMLTVGLALAVAMVVGCERGASRGKSVASAGASGVAAPRATSPGSSAKRGRAARLVLIDLEKSCACTERRTASALKALAAVLGKPPSVPLDRFHLDTQAAQADPFVDKRPIMVAPGLYVLDASGNIIDLLQGDITEAQIRGIIR